MQWSHLSCIHFPFFSSFLFSLGKHLPNCFWNTTQWLQWSQFDGNIFHLLVNIFLYKSNKNTNMLCTSSFDANICRVYTTPAYWLVFLKISKHLARIRYKFFKFFIIGYLNVWIPFNFEASPLRLTLGVILQTKSIKFFKNFNFWVMF